VCCAGVVSQVRIDSLVHSPTHSCHSRTHSLAYSYHSRTATLTNSRVQKVRHFPNDSHARWGAAPFCAARRSRHDALAAPSRHRIGTQVHLLLEGLLESNHVRCACRQSSAQPRYPWAVGSSLWRLQDAFCGDECQLYGALHARWLLSGQWVSWLARERVPCTAAFSPGLSPP
jgi:hypothetical protein